MAVLEPFGKASLGNRVLNGSSLLRLLMTGGRQRLLNYRNRSELANTDNVEQRLGGDIHEGWKSLGLLLGGLIIFSSFSEQKNQRKLCLILT